VSAGEYGKLVCMFDICESDEVFNIVTRGSTKNKIETIRKLCLLSKVSQLQDI